MVENEGWPQKLVKKEKGVNLFQLHKAHVLSRQMRPKVGAWSLGTCVDEQIRLIYS